MTKIIYFLVIIAVIAQTYAMPADADTGAASPAAAAAQEAQTAAAAPAAAAQQQFNPIGQLTKIVQPMVEESQKLFNTLLGMKPTGTS